MADKPKKKCAHCKELKDHSECCSFRLTTLYCAHFGIPLPDDPKNKDVVLCRNCLGVLAQRETKKRHYELPKYKISRSPANNIRLSLRTGRNGCWEKLVGYTLRELKKHLEKQFQQGMT